MTFSVSAPTNNTGALLNNGTEVLSVESDNSIDIDSGTLHVDAANNRVGIGTNSPSQPLHVSAPNDNGVRVDAEGNNVALMLTDETTSNGFRFNYNAPQDVITIDTTDGVGTKVSERMRINSSGNVMLGTTSTNSFILNVVSPDTARAIGAYRQSTSTTNMTLAVYSDVTATNTNHFRVDADGDVRNTNNSYGALSDQTIKQQIVDANSQLEDIKAVQVRKYKLNSEVEAFGDDAPIHIGVIAQELESAGMSGLVDEDEETNLKSVKYSVLYLKALKALQEAITKIEDLETRIQALESN